MLESLGAKCNRYNSFPPQNLRRSQQRRLFLEVAFAFLALLSSTGVSHALNGTGLAQLGNYQNDYFTWYWGCDHPLAEDISGCRLQSAVESDASKSTILGADSNGDGIRDDVFNAITNSYLRKPNIKASSLAIARRYQRILSLKDSGDYTQINKAVAEINGYHDCIATAGGTDEDGIPKVIALQLNTAQRTRVYLSTLAEAYSVVDPSESIEVPACTTTTSGRKLSRKPTRTRSIYAKASKIDQRAVFFINGVSNTRNTATETIAALENSLDLSPIDLLYNKNHLLVQVFDLYIEKSGESGNHIFDTSAFWQMLTNTM